MNWYIFLTVIVILTFVVLVALMVRSRSKVASFADKHPILASVAMIAGLSVFATVIPALCAGLAMLVAERVINGVLAFTSLPTFEFSHPGVIELYAAMVGLLWTANKTWHWFTVYVPPLMGLITVDHFTGAKQKYRTGRKFKFPWKQVFENMWFIQEMISVDFKMLINSKDGGQLEVEGLFAYEPCFERAETYVSIDEATIGKGIVNEAKQVIIEECGGRLTKRIISKIEQIRKNVQARYVAVDAELEVKFGIDFKHVSISAMRYTGKTQETLDADLQDKLLLRDKKTDKERLDSLILLGKPNVSRHEDLIRVRGEGQMGKTDTTLVGLLAGWLKRKATP